MKSIVMCLLVAFGALFGVSLLQMQGVAAAPVRVQAAVPTPPQIFFISSSSNLTLKNDPAIKTDDVKAADEDILVLNPGATPGQGTFSLYFDGSDVGLKNIDVDAFELVGDDILMSFDKPLKMIIGGTPNVLVDDSDIVRFVGTAGPNTSGVFEPCFDGSAFDLSSGSEDIDAITFDAQGRLVISTDGTAKVNGTSLVAQDEDLLALGSGAFTCGAGAGSWSLFLDGEDLALKAGSEDIGGAWIDNSVSDVNIYLSTKGNFKAANGVNAITGDSDDIFGFSATGTGETSTGFFFAVYDGDLDGLKKTIDGIFATPGVVVMSAALHEVDVPVAVVQYEAMADDTATDDAEVDENDSANEALDAEEIVSKVLLPLVTAE
jgi:hypothetical protein